MTASYGTRWIRKAPGHTEMNFSSHELASKLKHLIMSIDKKEIQGSV